MSATMSLNGKPRKQLADQLDRLDGILDVLGDGLSAAVADAMKAGTAAAVKEALVEVLTNPNLLATLRAGLAGSAEAAPLPKPVTEPTRPGLFARLKAKLVEARSKVASAVCGVKTGLGRAATTARLRVTRVVAPVVARVASITRTVTAVATLTHVVRKARQAALVAGLFVVMAGVMGLFAPHLLTAAVSGITAAVTVVGLGARDGARRFLALN